MALFRMIRRSPWWRVMALVAVVMLVFPSVAAADPRDTGNWLDPNSPVGSKIAVLYNYVYLIAIGVFVIVEGLLLYAVVRYRFRAGKEQQVVPQVHGNTTLEITWTAIPALIVAGLFVLTFNTMSEIQAGPDGGVASLNPNHVAHNAELSLAGQAPAGALVVEVIGHQWWWEFRYPELGITTATFMHVPAGRPIEVVTSSRDVIHSWWVPKMTGKLDAVPGVTNATWFQATEPGVYHAQCAEFCGVEHAVMRFRVQVDAQADFDGWVANQQKLAPAAAEAQTKRGEELFKTKACVSCHAVSGHPDPAAAENPAKIGPSLTHLMSRNIIAGDAMHWDANDLEGPAGARAKLSQWLHNPDQVKPGNLMSTVVKPGYLTDDEVQALVAYLLTLK